MGAVLSSQSPFYLQGSNFQAVLATDGQTTIVLIIYGTLTSSEVGVWFSRGDSGDVIVPPSVNNTVEPRALMEGSNVGISGIYVFQIASSMVFEHGKCRLVLGTRSTFATDTTILHGLVVLRFA